MSHVDANTEQSDPTSGLDPSKFRRVLGQYPTGVCVITALQPDGQPTGMVVGSFTSVSLDPPLVAFYPDQKAGAWARLRDSARFCVNILSTDQEGICRKLASKDPDKFVDIPFFLSHGGCPVIEGVVAWIDCDSHSVEVAGDHFIVMGLVSQLEIAAGGLPLLFFQGGYGRFSPSSIVASDAHGLLTSRLRIIDSARPEMERIALDLSARCIGSTCIENEVIIAVSAGQARNSSTVTWVGQRLPFIPPVGSVFAAWFTDDLIEDWIGKNVDATVREKHKRGLADVRKRGYSVTLLNEAQREIELKLGELAETKIPAISSEMAELVQGLDCDPPEFSTEICASIRTISAPVFDETGEVVLALTLDGFPKCSDCDQIIDYAKRLCHGAERVTALLAGQRTR